MDNSSISFNYNTSLNYSASLYEDSKIKNLELMDKFTHNYEIARRKGEDYDEEIKILRDKIAYRRNEISKLGLLKQEDLKGSKKIADLEMNLSYTNSILGKLCNENNELKEKIQILRRTAMKCEKREEDIKHEIIRSKSATKTYLSTSSANMKKIKFNANALSKLNQSVRTENINYTTRESALNTTLREVSKRATPTKLKRPRTPHSEYSDFLKVSKFLSKNWIKFVIAKKADMDKYDNHLQEIIRAFNALGSSIAVYDVTEIAEIILSSYEQELRLKNMLLDISEEVDKVQKNIEWTHESICEIKQKMKDDKTIKDNELIQKREELMILKALKDKELAKSNFLDNECQVYFKKIQQINKRIKNFESFSIATKQRYLSNIADFSNHEKYISRLEEYIRVIQSIIFSMNSKKIITPIDNFPKAHSMMLNKIKDVDVDVFTPEFDEMIEPLSRAHFTHRARKYIDRNPLHTN